MRILVTADLHYDLARSRASARTRIGRAGVVNIGSTYVEKRLEVLGV